MTEGTSRSDSDRTGACVFVAHGLEGRDREAARRLSELLMRWGFDVHFDGLPEPQGTSSEEAFAALVKGFDTGLSCCTHVLCVLSVRTVSAWWVPYLLGGGRAQSKRTAVLFLSEVTSGPLYLQLAKVLCDLEDLAQWTHSLPGGERMSQWLKMQVSGEEVADILPAFRVGLPRFLIP